MLTWYAILALMTAAVSIGGFMGSNKRVERKRRERSAALQRIK
jgi:hypothetical protein